MNIGQRLHSLRHEMGISQGDIEKRTGLLRSYISRVENGHTVPSVGTLEKIGAALAVPLYRFFYYPGDSSRTEETPAGLSKKEARFLEKIRFQMSQMNKRDQHLFLSFARILARK